MKKYLLASVAVLGLVAAGAASAADLPSRKGPVAAPMYLPPAFTWTGFYVGGNAGYAWGNVNRSGGVAITNTGDLDGFVGGGQVGYNYQIGQFVLGAEADIQGADLSTGGNLGALRVKTDYFGTVRARVGFAFDRFMPYVTGGWAYGNVKTTIPGVGFSSDQTHTGGYAVGGGLEYALTNNVILGAEYLYVDLGEKRVANTVGTKVGTDFSVVRARLSYKF